MNKIKLVFMGTPQIAVNSLKKLYEKDDIEVCCVVTQPDRPAGRGHKLMPPPVKVMAEELGIQTFQTTSIRKDNELLENLKEIKPDFFITIAFGQILSQEVLDIPKFGTINLHASLLPLYRGANPIARAIANGDKKTGVTTMLTSLGLDEGDIVKVQEIDITENMTTMELSEIISDISPEMLYKTMHELVENKVVPVKQDSSKATYANKFTKEETFLDFSKSAKELHNIVRALYPKPSANTYYSGSLIKILETEVIKEHSSEKCGKIIKKDKKGIYVATSDGVLLVKTLKPEGKKEMSATSWSCGLKSLDKFGE